MTFRRPESLQQLLRALPRCLEALRDDEEPKVIVVDNDPDGSARPVVDAAAPTLPVLYVREDEPGISAARNRALAEAGDARYVAFIDDDERPGDQWLRSLLDMATSSGAPVVTGPVHLETPDSAPPSVKSAIDSMSIDLPDGAVNDWPSTANVLLDLEALPEPPRFHADFGLSGGSDLLLFQSLRRRGVTASFARRAEVWAPVSKDRATWRWLCRRHFRLGNTQIRVDRHLDPGLGCEIANVLKACGWVARATRDLLAGALRLDGSRVLRGVTSAARAAGRLTGAFGYTYVEYRR